MFILSSLQTELMCIELIEMWKLQEDYAIGDTLHKV